MKKFWFGALIATILVLMYPTEAKAEEVSICGFSAIPVESLERAFEEQSEVKERMEIVLQDYTLFLQIIESEAQGGTFEQKLNVASCIFNRVEHWYYPDNIKDVVLQGTGSQFEVVLNNHYETVDISRDTFLAVEWIIENGPVHNYIFFCMPEVASTNRFFKKLEPEYYDGMHYYYSWR